jgi:acetyl esterase/lipase
MIVIHGGGWYLVGDETVRALDSAANSWRAVGWETVNIDYRACSLSVGDAVKFFDLVRNKVGPRVPICITGQSAGAHLALMIAAARQDVACVIGEGTPTDFSTIIAQGNAEAANGSAAASLKAGSRWAYGIARAAFGLGGLDAVSPINFASSIKARLLLGTSAGDGFVPYQQAEELASAIHDADPSRYVDVDRLESGSVSWVHAPVSPAANADFNRRVAALVRPYGSAPGQAVFGLPGLFNLGFHFG